MGKRSTTPTQEQREIQAAVTKFAEENQITDPQDMAILLSLLGMNYGAAENSSSGPGLGFSAVSGFAGGYGQGLGGK